jgi:hypothetical protein
VEENTKSSPLDIINKERRPIGSLAITIVFVAWCQNMRAYGPSKVDRLAAAFSATVPQLMHDLVELASNAKSERVSPSRSHERIMSSGPW